MRLHAKTECICDRPPPADSGDEVSPSSRMPFLFSARHKFSRINKKAGERKRSHTCHIYSFSWCSEKLRRSHFMVTWTGVWASSLHSHGSLLLWLCLSFFSSLHFFSPFHEPPEFFHKKKKEKKKGRKTAPLRMFPSCLLKLHFSLQEQWELRNQISTGVWNGGGGGINHGAL